MRPHEGGVRPVSPGQTPVTAPGTPVKKPKAFSYRSMETAKVNAVGSHSVRRRWRRKPRFTLSDAAAWLFFFLLTAAGLLAFCILATIVWPKP